MKYVWPVLEIPTTHAPFGGVTGDFDIEYAGEDWSAGAFILTIAATQGGSPVITLTNAAAGSQGVLATYDAAMIHPDTNEVVGGTLIRATILEAALEAITWSPTPVSDPLNFYFDLLVTPSGGLQRYVCEGPIKLWKGVGD